jgi:peptidoglycan/xylan/chitin deacetylase (PgdA/CDA1 family)
MFKRNILIVIAVLALFSGCTTRKPQNSSESYKNQSMQSNNKTLSSILSSSSHKTIVNSISSQSSSASALKTGNANSVPVLMYHSIIYEKNNSARVSKETFEQQMKWLYDNGYKTVTLEELYEHLQSKTKFPDNCVAITFDDGYVDNYTNAFPVLKQYGFTATIFMIAGKINTDSYLTSPQLKEMSDNGISIQGHTVTHPHMDTLAYAKQYEELASSKATLEAITGKKVEFLAYPYGKYNKDTIKALKTIGYKMAFKMSGGFTKLSFSQYELPRVYEGDNLDKFITSFKN